MPRYFIFVPAKNSFVGALNSEGAFTLVQDRKLAEPFRETDVDKAARSALQTPNPQVRRLEATTSEVKAWAGRKGGRTLTGKKRRALKRIARRERRGTPGSPRSRKPKPMNLQRAA